MTLRQRKSLNQQNPNVHVLLSLYSLCPLRLYIVCNKKLFFKTHDLSLPEVFQHVATSNLHAWSLSSMADRQRNGVKSFVNSVCCYGRQPVKTILFDKIMKCKDYLKQTELCHSLLIFSWLRCHMKGQKMKFLEMWFLFEIQIPSFFSILSSNWF